MDLKCPSSGEAARNRWENLGFLSPADEVKFVIGSQQDYCWAREIVIQHRLNSVCTVLFSCVAPLPKTPARGCLKPVPPGHEPISRRELAEQILRDGLPVRFQIQLHKEIWPPETRGV
jgi:7-carboxy-7-deazaguanine synthase